MTKSIIPIDEIWANYQKTKSVWETAKAFGICGQSVHERLAKNGYKLDNPKFTKEEDEIIKKVYSFSQGMRNLNLHKLTELLGRSHHTNVARRARQLGLTDKGRTHTIEQRDANTIRNREDLKNGKLKRAFPNQKNGWHDFLGGKRYFLRSSWEAKYASYLDGILKIKAIKDWLYEPDTFWFEKIRRGVRSYVPDFKIFHLDGSIEYHEVKGYMDTKSKTKIKRMRVYHPKIKLIVLERKELKSLGVL